MGLIASGYFRHRWLATGEAILETVDHGSLSDLLCHANSFSVADRQRGSLPRARNAALMAEAEWRAAISALAELLPTLPRQTTLQGHPVDAVDGITLSGPLPVLNEADFGQRFESWVVTPQPLATALQPQRFLSPAVEPQTPASRPQGIQVLPLVLENPLLAERFCLVLTPTLSVALVLGQPTGGFPCFQYSFDPAVLIALWQHIRDYIAEPASHSLNPLHQRITNTVGPPDFRVITRFTQGLVANLPHRVSEAFVESDKHGNLHYTQVPHREVTENDNSLRATHALADPEAESKTAIHAGADTELLQAMAHEIRTPLTTIRTLTRSLLRRKDVSSEVKKRLARIDEECTQQIDRFNLIFRAVELETTERDRPRSSLTPIALSQIFNDAVPRWQQQAQRRNLDLSVTLPPNLPRVNSDPTLLNEVLTGVVEWFTQCLPPHSHVHMVVMLAGHQLKLQFEAESTEKGGAFDPNGATKRQPLKSIGQLLTVVPETGGVSLNLDVTKNLFEFLGGKLILRQRPEQGEVLTAFLPLDTREI